MKLIAVGKIKNKALASLCADYAERLSHFGGIDITEIRDSDPETEGMKMLESLAKFKGRIYALTEEGRQMSSRELSKLLEADLMRGGSCFLIGGPYGLSENIKKSAHETLSISKMTFTHEAARAIWLEQLYRAKTISKGMSYHH